MDQLASVAARIAHRMGPTDLARCAQALAEMGHYSNSFKDALADAVVSNIDTVCM